MFKSYLKIAIRQLWKHKLFSTLNIFGLAVSMSICLLLILILVDQYSYDNFHEKKDRIYRVISERTEKNIPLSEPHYATTSLYIAEPLKENYPFIEKATRIASTGSNFHLDEKEIGTEKGGYIVDNDFLEMFSFGWKTGEQNTALQNPQSIVLTETLASTIFPEGNAVGQTVKYGNMGMFTITGIMPEPPIRSHIQFDHLVSYATVEAYTEEQKRDLQMYGQEEVWRGLVYVLLAENTAESQFGQALSEIAADWTQRSKDNQFLFEPQVLSDVLPSRDLGNDIGIGTPRIVLYFLMSLGLIIILAACFNYMNLSVARSLKRAKEIGIRKVIGARKKDVIFQFLGEAILIALLSLVVAMGLLEFLIPAFYGLDPFVETIFHVEKTPMIYGIFFLFSLFVGLMAGIFPAFNISRFQPIQAIQQLSNVKVFSKVGFRKVLITAQFALSLIFILTVIIVLKQQKHILNADLGINVENLMGAWLNDVDYDVFAQQVEQLSGVESINASRHTILVGEKAYTMAKFNNLNDSVNLSYNIVDEAYLENMDIELLAGKNFPTNSHSEGEQFILLNEKAVQRMGFETPNQALGSTVTIDTNALTVIGVVKDFHHDNVWFEPIQPYGLRNGGDYKQVANIRLAANADISKTVRSIYDISDNMNVKTGISSFFVDERLYNLSKFFKMGSSIIGFVGFLTILIACMGLLGMVIYNVEGRIKEVGIRKVFGASEGNIIWHLSKGFFMLLGIAIAIAVPLTLLAANAWLQNFILRINIGPLLLMQGVGIMLLLGLVTVISQTFKAARNNPIESLRTE